MAAMRVTDIQGEKSTEEIKVFICEDPHPSYSEFVRKTLTEVCNKLGIDEVIVYKGATPGITEMNYKPNKNNFYLKNPLPLWFRPTQRLPRKKKKALKKKQISISVNSEGGFV